MESGERPISYAHYEDLGSETVTGVFLTSARLYVLSWDPLSLQWDHTEIIPLSNVAMAGPVRGRVIGRQGAWALTRIIRLEDEDGFLAPGWTWVLIPRRSLMARRVSRMFLEALRTELGDRRWVGEVTLNRAARKRRGDFLYESWDQACAVSREMSAIRAAKDLERAELEGLRESAGIVGDPRPLKDECDAWGAHTPGPPSPFGWIGCSNCGVMLQRPSWWPHQTPPT
jgi:hypothetical protein